MHHKGHEITTERSELTGNYLLLIDGIIFDSAIDKQDLNKVKQWLVNQLKVNPLGSSQNIHEWIKSCRTQPPKTKAYVLTWKNGQCNKEVIYG